MPVIRYLVNDVQESLPFYEALGFKMVESWGPPFAILERSDLTLWLSGPGTSAQRPMPDGSLPIPGGWNRFVLQVEDIGETIGALTAIGTHFRSERISGPGGDQILIEDASGNPIEIFQEAK